MALHFRTVRHVSLTSLPADVWHAERAMPLSLDRVRQPLVGKR